MRHSSATIATLALLVLTGCAVDAGLDAAPQSADASGSDALAGDDASNDARTADVSPTSDARSDAPPTVDAPPDAPPDAGGCATGTHDGGDGACVPLGRCSEGFRRLYVDADGDGYRGELAEPCFDGVEPPPEGFIEDGGDDCDDDDPEAWNLALFHLDADGDGVTTPMVEVCYGAEPPDSVRAAPGLAPALGINPGTLDGFLWDELAGVRAANIEGNCPIIVCGLTVSDLKIELPEDAVIEGIRLGTFIKSEMDVAAFGSATLRSDGFFGTLNFAQNGGNPRLEPGVWTRVDLGGPNALWTVNPNNGIQASDIASPDFEVMLNYNVFGGWELGGIFVEVFHDRGTFDCDDADPDAYVTLEGYLDADGDGVGSGEPVTRCVGPMPPPDFSRHNTDCDDDSIDVHALVTMRREVDRGDGSFDYNCDGAETPQVLRSVIDCVFDQDSGCQRQYDDNFTPAPCGERNVYGVCSPQCELREEEEVTRCR